MAPILNAFKGRLNKNWSRHPSKFTATCYEPGQITRLRDYYHYRRLPVISYLGPFVPRSFSTYFGHFVPTFWSFRTQQQSFRTLDISYPFWSFRIQVNRERNYYMVVKSYPSLFVPFLVISYPFWSFRYHFGHFVPSKDGWMDELTDRRIR